MLECLKERRAPAATPVTTTTRRDNRGQDHLWIPRVLDLLDPLRMFSRLSVVFNSLARIGERLDHSRVRDDDRSRSCKVKSETQPLTSFCRETSEALHYVASSRSL